MKVTRCGFCSTKNASSSTLCKECGRALEHIGEEDRQTRRAIAIKAKFAERKLERNRKGFKAYAYFAVALLSVGVLILGLNWNSPQHGSGGNTGLNPQGLPSSCSTPELLAMGTAVLYNGFDLKGKIQVVSQGYANSFVDAHQTGAELISTSVPSKYASLTCTYSVGKDSGDSPTFEISLDSVSEPRSWAGSIDEEVLKWGFGEKLVVYYPEGEGYEYGGGNMWRVWIGQKYLNLASWSPTPRLVTLPQPELKSLITLLKGN